MALEPHNFIYNFLSEEYINSLAHYGRDDKSAVVSTMSNSWYLPVVSTCILITAGLNSKKPAYLESSRPDADRTYYVLMLHIVVHLQGLLFGNHLK